MRPYPQYIGIDFSLLAGRLIKTFRLAGPLQKKSALYPLTSETASLTLEFLPIWPSTKGRGVFFHSSYIVLQPRSDLISEEFCCLSIQTESLSKNMSTEGVAENVLPFKHTLFCHDTKICRDLRII